MKYLYGILLAAAWTLGAVVPASAQISVDEIDMEQTDAAFVNEVKPTAFTHKKTPPLVP